MHKKEDEINHINKEEPLDHINKESQFNDFNRVDEKALKSWRVARIITLIVVAIILIGGRIFIRNWDKAFVLGATIIDGIILLFLDLNAFLYPKIEYMQWKYKITEDKIEFYHGIFFIKHTIIPMLRIQHITVNQGPISKKYNVADIGISTAGGVFKLVGLPKEKADEICEYINNKVIKKIKDKLSEDEIASEEINEIGEEINE